MDRTIMSEASSAESRASHDEAERPKTKRIPRGLILPSAAFTIKRRQIKRYRPCDKPPQPGDVVYGVVIAFTRPRTRMPHRASPRWLPDDLN
jgi:hypothetical protein